MARETKTIQCYPDDRIINERVKRYEAFGWELINNQRCQEYEGQTSSHDFIDGGTVVTSHYSTFNKLTFSRDKSALWYAEVVELEKEHDRLLNTEPDNYAVRPSNNWLLGIFGLLIGIVLFTMGMPPSLIAIPCVLLAISVLFIVIWIVKKVHQKRDTEDYYKRMREWRNTTAKEAEKIRIKAESIVNA